MHTYTDGHEYNSHMLSCVSIATPNKQSVHVVTPPQQKEGRNQDSEAKKDIKVR